MNKRERKGGLPLSRAARHGELFERVADSERMLAVFRRELPALADARIEVTDCRAKATRSRKAIRAGRLEVVYKVGIAVDGGPRVEHVLFGIAPSGPELLDSELKAQRDMLRGHAWAAPFRDVALYLADLRLALLFFPLDPALPGLAEITGNQGARLLAAVLPEGRAGERIERIDCSLVHYKPFKRAVLRVRVALSGVRGAGERVVYAKLFADERGAATFQNLTALWTAARNSLRLPEPLGYDAGRRMLVMGEAPGQRDLTAWVRCLESGEPLPAGVDLARMHRCARVAARSLLELQRSGVRPDEHREFRDELGRVKKDCALMLTEVREKQPELSASAAALLRRLSTLAPEHEELVPAHGCYRHDQMVGDELSLTPIDWDGFSLASPALDAAAFLARLGREPRRSPGAAPELEQVAATFRSAFLEGRPELARDLDLHEALLVAEQMLRAFRRPGDAEETTAEVRQLAAAAERLLDRVEGAPRPQAAAAAALSARHDPVTRANGRGRAGVSLSTAPEHRDLFASVVDRERMLDVFRSVLPALADGEIRVLGCKAKPSKSRRSIRQGRLDVVYRVEIEVQGKPREFTLLGVAPAPPALLDAGLMERCRELRNHPWAAPFRELATYVEELRLALLLFPLDPALPGLAEVTGSAGARVLAGVLPECRAGAEVVEFEAELVRYKPLDRAVVRIRSSLRDPHSPTRQRNVYAKFFADDQGAAQFRQLMSLWSAARGATCLRLPEPLGYDAERRMLVLAEAPGGRDLPRWVKCLERGEPLPSGVDPARLERCARVVARALHELQASSLQPELRRTFRRELARVQADRTLLLDDVRATEPELAGRAEALVERLERLAPAEERLVPAHGCWRHKQMLGEERSLTFIDWDGLSLASPALDAATFLGRLCREPRRIPGSAPLLAQMGAAFRHAFLEDRPELARDLALYEGLVLTEQVLRAFRRPGDRAETAHEVRFLAAAAAEMLDRVEDTPGSS